MKKLNKLQINSEKLMKNEELIILRGGYNGTGCCVCKIGQATVGVFAGSDSTNCYADCKYTYGNEAYGSWTC